MMMLGNYAFSLWLAVGLASNKPARSSALLMVK